MRILHLSPYYKPAYAFGGVPRAVEGMATALAARGHEVTVLTTDAFDQQERYAGPHEETLDGLRVWRCANVSPWLRGRLNLSSPRGLRQAAASILPTVDVLHAHEFRTLENLLVLPLAQKLGKPVLLSPHGTLNLASGRGRLKAAWDRLFGAGSARRVKHVIALTASELAEVKALWAALGIKRAPGFSVIPNGVRLEEFATEPPVDAFRADYGLGTAPTVLFMGRLHARKGADVLVKAFRAAAVENSRLLIVGPDEGMLGTLFTLAAGDRRIVFTGYLSGAARLQALQACDIFALPANGEGQPIAVLEALAAGLPALLSPGCHLDEVEAAGAGYVVEPSAWAFAEKLRVLLPDAERRRAMAAAARQLVAEKYTWEKVAADLEQVYLSLV